MRILLVEMLKLQNENVSGDVKNTEFQFCQWRWPNLKIKTLLVETPKLQNNASDYVKLQK